MIGDWLHDDTPVAAVAAFAKKVFGKQDFSGFTGDPRFIQNASSHRMFSKLRSSVGGLYAWRMNHATYTVEKDRMAHEAALYQGIEAVVNRGHGNVRRPTFDADENLLGGRVIALLQQHVINMLALRRGAQTARAQPLVQAVLDFAVAGCLHSGENITYSTQPGEI